MNGSGQLLANFSDLHTLFTPHTTLPVNPFHVVVEVPVAKWLAFGTIKTIYQNGIVSDSAISHQAVNSWPALVTSGGDISLHEELGRSRQGQCHGLRVENNKCHKKSQKPLLCHFYGTLWHFMDVEPPNSPGGWAIAPYNQQSPRSSVAICGNGREERNVYNPRMVEKCRKSLSPDLNRF